MDIINSTKDIAISNKISEQIIGQDQALELIRKAAKQRRNMLLIGDPGTGKSMLGQALAELLPQEELIDILSLPNQTDENTPKIKTVQKGQGEEIVTKARLQSATSFKNQSIILILVTLFISLVPYYFYSKRIFPFDEPIVYAASMITGVFFIIGFILFFNLSKRMKNTKKGVPKLLVDNSKVDNAPF